MVLWRAVACFLALGRRRVASKQRGARPRRDHASAHAPAHPASGRAGTPTGTSARRQPGDDASPVTAPLNASWLGAHAPYAALGEAAAAACDGACRARLRASFDCELKKAPLDVPGCAPGDSNALWASLRARVAAPRAACAGPHGAARCYDAAGGFCVLSKLRAPANASRAFCAPFAKDHTRPGYERAAEACAWTVHCDAADGDAAELERRLSAKGGKPGATRWPRIRLVGGAPPPGAAFEDGRVHYLARRGDCGGSGPNPAHCAGDLANFYAVLHLAASSVLGANATRDATRVLLGHGYAYGYDGLAAWGGDAGARADDVALYLLWRAGAAAVDRLADAVDGDATYGGPAGAAFVAATAVTAPAAMAAITWGPKNCKAQVRSDVLATLRRRADAFLDAHADALLPRLPNASRGYALVVERRAPEPERRRRLGGKGDARRRHVHNMGDLLAALRAARPELDVRPVAFDGSIPWALQVALWRRATLVVGLHGGALANALFLSPGQGLVEITPREHSCGHPSMFAHVAVAVGATYRGVLCAGCTMRSGGAVDVPAVLRAVAAVLDDDPKPALMADGGT